MKVYLLTRVGWKDHHHSDIGVFSTPELAMSQTPVPCEWRRDAAGDWSVEHGMDDYYIEEFVLDEAR